MKHSNCVYLLALSLFVLMGCGSENSDPDLVIQGEITVDSELDASGDYSGIELLVAQNSVAGTRDTLFYSVTDSTGQHYGTANIEESGLYPLFISRNNQPLGIFNVVLAQGDTITINGQLPNISENAEIVSHENDVFEKYDRVQRSYQRVVNFISSRGMSTDSVEAEVRKWSDLFWDLHQENPNTFAGEQSASVSASILEGWDNDLMLARTDSVLAEYNTVNANLRTQLTAFYASRDSLERSISFLNKIESRLENTDQKLPVRQEKIELLFDSSRIDRASELLEEFKQTYRLNPAAMGWAGRMDKDITTLAPGKTFPAFSFRDSEGNIVSSDSLEGTAYMIEFTRLENPLYQQQYDRVIAIQQVYSNFGLDVITVPIGASDVLFDAFFEERARLWTFADPGSFTVEELRDRYNLYSLPTRFLVNDQGQIVQRYVGTEFNSIVQGLQKTLTQTQTES
jgi:hypothetical protein